MLKLPREPGDAGFVPLGPAIERRVSPPAFDERTDNPRIARRPDGMLETRIPGNWRASDEGPRDYWPGLNRLLEDELAKLIKDIMAPVKPQDEVLNTPISNWSKIRGPVWRA